MMQLRQLLCIDAGARFKTGTDTLRFAKLLAFSVPTGASPGFETTSTSRQMVDRHLNRLEESGP